ncbi:ULP_PROTEASE domain-containing protein [Caenorhabditis elegans]|uniref:ULP_PROTEASE domain-containing protein n=1 Tax=Caenorhabditis elegans TaxID=6239 RepID=O45408_CAEEL|nr:ULP_PROTEASE domain-containing protein [Caenorhabditis elegans]CAB04196.2 ULP_PROTEASE domain-containing protein [Caenorhabditis elegans]|eukprot:NP_496999.2 Uncharacterized protein CELE_F26H11.4 [Caenorhabditis elegans]
MDSDLKKVQKNSDQKQVSKSKTATAPTEPFNSKATELPSILKPKFPSDKVLKKKKSGDMFDLVGQIVIDIVDDNPDDDDRQDEATTVDTVQEGIGATVDVTLVEDVAEKAHEPASTPNVADRLQKPVAKDDNSAPVEEANRKKKEGKDPKNSEEAKKNSKKGKNGTARRSALKGVTIPPVAASLPCPPPPPPLSERKKNVGPKPCVGPAQKNLSSQRKHSSKRNRKGLLRNVAKLWGRKSDGIANPTKAMLSKKYVPPDYGVNPVDFMPDLECYFSKNDITVRDKNKCSKGEVFVEKLPFWLARLPSDDDIPKAQIQAHRPLKQAFEGNPSLLLPKCPRTLPFCEPDSDTLEKFKQVDKQMGTDVPEQASKRLCTNTFYGTLMFEKDKSASEEVKKKKEEPKLKSLGEESVKVNFSFPPKPILFIYSRKNRPRPPVREDDKSHSCKKCHPKNLKPERTFKKCEWVKMKKGDEKKTVTNSANSKSDTKSASFSAEGRK